MPTQMMQIQELLRGYVVDKSNIQSVGNMTVIPIISDVEFTNVADINDVKLKRDVTYNTLEFSNQSGQIGIIVQGWMMIEPNQKAQDRTVPHAQLIRAANSKAVPANCVQRTQGGLFDVGKLNQDNFMVLPPSLRGIALKKSSYTSSNVGDLWEDLGRWINGVDCNTNGLQIFYSQFEDKLDQFVAQFEPVEKQLGAIVIINGMIVAIDILPKYNSWKQCWRALIRNSYGAEAVRIATNHGSVDLSPKFDMTSIKSIDDLINVYEASKNSFYNQIQNLIGASAQLSLIYKELERMGELTMLKFENEQFVGQGVLHGSNHFIYLSLLNTKGKPTQTINQFTSLRREPYTDSSFFFR
jgi:hypothetical protein